MYPGVGWVVWRDAAALPDDLVFEVDYLGGEMPTFALNFSRPGAQVAAQYYMFLRLGFEGYREVQQQSRDTADWLAERIAGLGPFTMVTRGAGIPAITFRLTGEEPYSVFDLSEALRVKGWIVPAYHMPPAIQEMAVLRVVVRNGFSRDLASMFLDHLGNAVERLGRSTSVIPDEHRSAFHH